MSEQDYRRKLAEAIYDNYGPSLINDVQSDIDRIEAVLASEGVVDPETMKRLLCDKHVLWNWSGCRQCEVERLEAKVKELESRNDWQRQGGPILHLPGGDKRGD